MSTPMALHILFTLIFLILATTFAQAAQQCRLVMPGNLAAGSDNHHGGSSTATKGATGTASATATSSSSSASASVTAFPYGKKPVWGVNLGGWLVLEPWITPSFFESTGNDSVIDEYTLGQWPDRDTATTLLTKHWDTWYTEDDFAEMADAGINHVRIPLGYWSVPMTSDDTNYTTSVDPYIPGAWPYLLKGANWAKKHGIHVLVDIHGAPGSQNGYDNSGQKTNSPAWANSGTDHIARTLDILRVIARELGGLIDIIEVINEAGGFVSTDWANNIRGYFQDGYQVVRDEVGGDIRIMIGDAFLKVDAWENFLTPPKGLGVMMDWHGYQVFSANELSRTFDEHISYACSLIPDIADYAKSNLWTVLGEWSLAMTDCAKWLNGRGVGARWDGTWFDKSIHFGSCDAWTGNGTNFSSEYKDQLRKYWEVQVAIGESAQGWIFWAWKAENADDWSYKAGVEQGWIPKDPSDRKYPNICGS